MTASRRVLASSARILPHERLDLLVHALAQLPPDMALDVHGEGPDRERLETLAAAYGLDARVRFRPAGAEPAPGRVVYPSAVNAAAAPLRPDASSPTAVALDPDGRAWPAARTVRSMAELLAALSGPDDPPAPCGADPALLRGHAVAIVTNLPAAYRLPLFAGVGARLGRAGARLRVFFLGRGSAARPWLDSGAPPFDDEFLRSVELPLRRRPPLVPANLRRALDRFAPTLLLPAGFSPAVSGRIAAYAASHGIPFGVWSGEIARSATARSALRAGLRRRLVRRAGFGVSYGHLSGEYLHALRPDLPVVYHRNTSPPGAPRSRPTQTGTVRILAVGDLASPRKGVDVALAALRLRPDLPCELRVVGGGRRLPELSEAARGDSRIRFLSPLPAADVRAAYADADVLAFPTRADVFGLVLGEAMGAGLACAVSAAAGAVPDLAVDGVNALVVDGHEPATWAQALERLVEDHSLRERLGEEARRTIERRWTMEHSIDALVAGLRLGVLRSRAEAAA